MIGKDIKKRTARLKMLGRIAKLLKKKPAGDEPKIQALLDGAVTGENSPEVVSSSLLSLSISSESPPSSSQSHSCEDVISESVTIVTETLSQEEVSLEAKGLALLLEKLNGFFLNDDFVLNLQKEVSLETLKKQLSHTLRELSVIYNFIHTTNVVQLSDAVDLLMEGTYNEIKKRYKETLEKIEKESYEATLFAKLIATLDALKEAFNKAVQLKEESKTIFNKAVQLKEESKTAVQLKKESQIILSGDFPSVEKVAAEVKSVVTGKKKRRNRIIKESDITKASTLNLNQSEVKLPPEKTSVSAPEQVQVVELPKEETSLPESNQLAKLAESKQSTVSQKSTSFSYANELLKYEKEARDIFSNESIVLDIFSEEELLLVSHLDKQEKLKLVKDMFLLLRATTLMKKEDVINVAIGLLNYEKRIKEAVNDTVEKYILEDIRKDIDIHLMIQGVLNLCENITKKSFPEKRYLSSTNQISPRIVTTSIREKKRLPLRVIPPINEKSSTSEEKAFLQVTIPVKVEDKKKSDFMSISQKDSEVPNEKKFELPEERIHFKHRSIAQLIKYINGLKKYQFDVDMDKEVETTSWRRNCWFGNARISMRKYLTDMLYGMTDINKNEKEYINEYRKIIAILEAMDHSKEAFVKALGRKRDVIHPSFTIYGSTFGRTTGHELYDNLVKASKASVVPYQKYREAKYEEAKHNQR
jgi:phosphopantetheinyl transferase (holo-ACP synthase)